MGAVADFVEDVVGGVVEAVGDVDFGDDAAHLVGRSHGESHLLRACAHTHAELGGPNSPCDFFALFGLHASSQCAFGQTQTTIDRSELGFEAFSD